MGVKIVQLWPTSQLIFATEPEIYFATQAGMLFQVTQAQAWVQERESAAFRLLRTNTFGQNMLSPHRITWKIVRRKHVLAKVILCGALCFLLPLCFPALGSGMQVALGAARNVALSFITHLSSSFHQPPLGWFQWST